MKNLQDKVALVTGGTSGIGRATAVAYAKAGAKVVFCGRREKEGGETRDLIKQAGGEGIFVRSDIGVPSDVEELVKKTVDTYGRLDIAFNNAGIEGNVRGPIAEQSDDDYDEIMNINAKGVYLCMKHEVPAMLKNGGGVIVNNASVAGLIGMPFVAGYTASKHAVIALTKNVALDYATQGIRCNAVCPGFILTELGERYLEVVPREDLESLAPMNRIGEPEEIADAVLWLSSPQSSFVTGQAIAVDGGATTP